MIDQDEVTGDTELRLDEIRIKHYHEWALHTNFENNSSFIDYDKTLVIKEKVKVKSYRAKQFQRTFKDHFDSVDVLKQSLSPKYNRE